MAGTTFNDVVNAAPGEERESKIGELIALMDLSEKVGQMSGKLGLIDLAIMPFRYNHRPYPAGENERLGIPPVLFTDGPRGVTVGKNTCFPVSMMRGATWDPELEERVGDVMGVESRSQGANYNGGVCINLPRHPGWGRAQESFGEDPHLLGEMGSAMLRGMQRHVMACAKHFAVNSIEQARFFVDVQCTGRALHEIFLPHFKRCVDEGVASFMSAYNKMNGKFCGHNRDLLTGILKEQWGFDGFVVSDFLLGVRGPGAATFCWACGGRAPPLPGSTSRCHSPGASGKN